MTSRLKAFFEGIPDLRMERTKLHPLETILSIVLWGVLAGVDSWTGFEDYAQDHQDTLKHFIDLSSGVPSHDTIARVISTLDVKAFERAFHRFTATLVEKFQGIIALDGKTLRGSFDHRKGVKARHIVSAWADCCRLVLAQVKVDDKSNEITAIPELLALLDLKGQIVTLDAMGCQREICKQIVDQGGDYVISLKGNQGTLHQDVRLFFEDSQSVIEEIWEESDKGHGRVENRLCKATAEIDWLQKTHDWPGLGSIAAVRGRRETRTGVCEETRYYVSSLPADAERIGRAARAHWGVENKLHWVLDVTFREDLSRIRKDNGPEILSLIRKWALNLINQHKPPTLSVKRMLQKINRNPQNLMHILKMSP